MIHVMLADSDCLLGQCLRWVIDRQQDMSLVGMCSDEAGLFHQLERIQIDVMVMDPSTFGTRGMEVLHLVADRWPDVRAVVLTGDEHEKLRPTAIRAGAWGYLTKTADVGHVIETIRRVGRGEAVSISHALPPRPGTGERDRSNKLCLSPREHDVIRGLVRGRTNREIAEELGLTEKTAKNYVSTVFSKLDVRDRTQAAVRCVQMGLVSESVWHPPAGSQTGA